MTYLIEARGRNAQEPLAVRPLATETRVVGGEHEISEVLFKQCGLCRTASVNHSSRHLVNSATYVVRITYRCHRRVARKRRAGRDSRPRRLLRRPISFPDGHGLPRTGRAIHTLAALRDANGDVILAANQLGVSPVKVVDAVEGGNSALYERQADGRILPTAMGLRFADRVSTFPHVSW